MSKPVFDDLFSFSGRRNRKSYILLGLAQFVGFFLLAALVGVSAALLDSVPFLGYIVAIAALAGFIGIGVSAWASASQRIRDFGQSGVWILLSLIPYIGWVVCLAICFIPSDQGENKYGPSCI